MNNSSAPGVITLKISNPFSEGRNCVYIIDSDPLTMIDSGVATPRGYQMLLDGLAEHGIGLEDIGRVVLTHKHIDHIGNAWRIQRASGAEILIHHSEMEAISNVDPLGDQFLAVVTERLRIWQVPASLLSSVGMDSFPKWDIQSAEAMGVEDGQRIALSCGELEVLHFPGHTGGSIGIKIGDRLLAGDHVLPDVSPNIGGGDMQYRGLLPKYLDSLRRTIKLSPSIDQALPGHGEPFSNLAERCQTLLNHHQHRLSRTVEILRMQGAQSVYQVARQLFGQLRDFHVVLGCAEAQAHLEALVEEGRASYTENCYRAT